MWRHLLVFILLYSSPAFATEQLSIATGSPSGLYFPFGGGLARIWSKEIPKYNVKAEVTAASVANIFQVSKGESDLGITQGDALQEAIDGFDPFPEKMPVKVMLTLYPNVIHLVALKDSGIRAVSDLDGKRVSVGAAGSGSAITAVNVLSALGMQQEVANAYYLSYSETATALKDGVIDAGFMVGGLGLSAITELALTRDIQLIAFSEDELSRIHQAFPAYTDFLIPGGIYSGIHEDIPSVTLWNHLIVRDDMDENTAYLLTKTALAHQDKLLRITPYAHYMSAAMTATHALSMLHPGARRAIAEILLSREKTNLTEQESD